MISPGTRLNITTAPNDPTRPAQQPTRHSATIISTLYAPNDDRPHWRAMLDEPITYRPPAGFDMTRAGRDSLDRDSTGPFLWIWSIVVRGKPPPDDRSPMIGYIIDNSLGLDAEFTAAKVEFTTAVSATITTSPQPRPQEHPQNPTQRAPQPPARPTTTSTEPGTQRPTHGPHPNTPRRRRVRGKHAALLGTALITTTIIAAAILGWPHPRIGTPSSSPVAAPPPSSAASPSPSTSAPRPAPPAPRRPAGLPSLAALVPEGFDPGECRSSTLGPAAYRTLTCDRPTGAAAGLHVVSVTVTDTRAGLNDVYRDLLNASPPGVDHVDCRPGNNANAWWWKGSAVDAPAAGQMFCMRTAAGMVIMAWTDVSALACFGASRADGDLDALWAWWRTRTVSRPRPPR